jgi:hypothetical protein
MTDTVYRRGRAALAGLRHRHIRTFAMWMDWARAFYKARNEAMAAAEIDRPIGARYNQEFDRIVKRERLVDRLGQAPHEQFPDPNTRKDCIDLLENYERPQQRERQWGIREYLERLDQNERSKINHPTTVLRRWEYVTEPHRVDRLEPWGTLAQRATDEALGRASMQVERLRERNERLQQDLSDSGTNAALRLLINDPLPVHGIAHDITPAMLKTLVRKLQQRIRQMVDLPAHPAITDQTNTRSNDDE